MRQERHASGRPDSKTLLWSGSDHKLRMVDVESGKTDVVAQGEAGNVTSAQFSPDGKWISPTRRQDKLLRSHVWVKELATGQERMIGGEDFLQSSGAKWTPDGKKLLLIGGVGAPAMAALNRTVTQLIRGGAAPGGEGPGHGGTSTAEEQAMAAAGADAARAAAGGSGRGRAGRAGGGQDRLGRPRPPHHATDAHAGLGDATWCRRPTAGRTCSRRRAAPTDGPAAGGGPAMYTIDEDGTRLTRLNTTVEARHGRARSRRRRRFGGFNEPQWARDGRSIYFLQGGGLYSLAIGAAPATDAAAAAAAAGRGGRGGRGGTTAATRHRDRIDGRALRAASTSPSRWRSIFAAERRQVFEEAWRVMKNRFYDAKMHGVNWAAAKDKYESMLPHIADSEELHNVIMEMIGELNASPTPASPAAPGCPVQGAPQERIADALSRASTWNPTPAASTRSATSTARVRRTTITSRSRRATFILAVNGKDLKTSDNYWKLFNILPGRKFEFLVNTKPAAGRSVDSRPRTRSPAQP